MTFQPRSLDTPLPGGDETSPRALHDLIGGPDMRLEQVIDVQALQTHWPELPPIQQQVLLLRFYGNMTQADIGTQLGVSQMQVSRLQSRALNYLRAALQGDQPT
jgi:RNA polymerase sigma-B factor